ncbi:hypothetical protein HK405_008231, partial [Cladochytrium tenue]
GDTGGGGASGAPAAQVLRCVPRRDRAAAGSAEPIALLVEVGTALGLLGLNGAGKTTLISCLIGLMAPSDGVALISGVDITTEVDEIYWVI